MNCTVYTLERLAAVSLFPLAITATLRRAPVWWIHDFQDKYFQTHERTPTQAHNVPVLMKKCTALLLTLAVFVEPALPAGAPLLFARRYREGDWIN